MRMIWSCIFRENMLRRLETACRRLWQDWLLGLGTWVFYCLITSLKLSFFPCKSPGKSSGLKRLWFYFLKSKIKQRRFNLLFNWKLILGCWKPNNDCNYFKNYKENFINVPFPSTLPKLFLIDFTKIMVFETKNTDNWDGLLVFWGMCGH
jgi:hypothetical protein